MKNLNQSLLLALTLIIYSPIAFAVNSINVQTFNPSTSDHFVLIEDGFRSEWPKTAKFYFGFNYNFVTEPLIVLDSTQSTKLYDIIDNIQTYDFFAGFKVANNFGLFFGGPIHFVNYSATSPATFPHGSVSGLGDLKLLAKIRLTDDASNTSVALIPEFHLPTGSTENFVSDASTYVGLRMAVERQFESWSLAGNIGFAAAQNAIYQDSTFLSGIDYRKRLLVGIGGFLPFNDTVGMNVEFQNINMIPFDKALNPNDAYAGIRYVATEGLILTGGAALGKIGGPGGDDYRLIAGLRYTFLEDSKRDPQPISSPLPTPSPSPAAPVAAISPTPAPPETAAPIITIATKPHAVMQAKRIEILSPINFEHDSYKLMPDSKQILDDVATLMKENKTAYKKVLVDGHTSKVGKDKYNLKLSLARARSVKSYLIAQGVPAKALEPRGFGFRKPKVKVTDPNAMELNRRVEFIIVK